MVAAHRQLGLAAPSCSHLDAVTREHNIDSSIFPNYVRVTHIQTHVLPSHTYVIKPPGSVHDTRLWRLKKAEEAATCVRVYICTKLFLHVHVRDYADKGHIVSPSQVLLVGRTKYFS